MAKPLCYILPFLSLILLLQQPSSVASQNKGTVSVNQSLRASTNGSTWLSPSGDFAFGFHQFNHTTDLFLLAIWYAKIPDTVVWWANEGLPVVRGSTVTLTSDQGLVLADPRGRPLWNTSLNGGAISYGFMSDAGNFALQSSDDDVVWESFGYPTDTLLPTQVLERGGIVDSRLSETNFTKGRFQLRMLVDGNLVLNTRDLDTGFAYGAYYVSGTNNASDPSRVGDRVVYEKTGRMYIHISNGSVFDVLAGGKNVSSRDFYQRATLEFDGVLTWYSHPRASTGEGWTKVQSFPDNICKEITAFGGDFDSGACGYNSLCVLGDHQRPSCGCPTNFSLLDPNDSYGSCKPDFRLGECGESEDIEYKLVELPDTDWPSGDYARLDPCSSQEDCKASCLNDCFCAAAVWNQSYQVTGTCWKKKLPLSNGRRGSWVSRTAWLKVATGDSSVVSPLGRAKHRALVSALLGGSASLNFLLLGAILLWVFLVSPRRRSTTRRSDVSHTRALNSEFSNVTSFSYQELKEATDGFKEEIGRGAFGVVYKGSIGGSVGPQALVAVKKLDRISEDADKEFKAEVDVIGRTHHRNLVRLIGYCKEGQQRMLVYEYMSNGTLADYLFGGGDCGTKPKWEARIQIARGVARGLLYLHEECYTRIIHCDIKPQNILLDECHTARISDFGLAKLLALTQTQTNTGIRGTRGYVAPEWFRNKPVTVKVDVYSFGVLLLELICCRRNVCADMSVEEGAILSDWAFDCYRCGTLDALVSHDADALGDRVRLERLVKVALWCVQEDPSLRPTMRTVTQMVDGLVQVPDPPCATATSFSISSLRISS